MGYTAVLTGTPGLVLTGADSASFQKFGVLFVGGLIIGALLFGVHIRAPWFFGNPQIPNLKLRPTPENSKPQASICATTSRTGCTYAQNTVCLEAHKLVLLRPRVARDVRIQL